MQVENSHPRVHHSHARVETRALIDEHPAFVYDHRSAIDVEPVVGAAAVGLVVSHNTLAVATSPNPSFSPNVLELAAAASGRIYGNVITAKKTGLQGFPATALHVGAAFTGTIDHNTIRGGDIGVLTEAAPFQRQHVVGNTIGAAGSGTVGGISVVRPSAGTMIGGGDLTKLAGNVITCNTGDGIVATGGTATIAGNTVSGHKGANARCIAADGTVQVLSNVVYDNAQGIVGAGAFTSIAKNEVNDGTFTWSIDTFTFPAATSYAIRISSVATPAVSGLSPGAFKVLSLGSITTLSGSSLQKAFAQIGGQG